VLRLPAGRWNLSLQYFSPVGVELRARSIGFRTRLKPALDGQRPNQLTLFNDGQYWPAGPLRLEAPTRLRFELSVDEPNTLQRLSDYGGNAYFGELTARQVGPQHTLPLPGACESWVDFYAAAGRR
jgi:hypothetical protein